jgi:hypothetical protein
MLKQYSEALPLLRECVSRAPNLRGGHTWLATIYASWETLMPSDPPKHRVDVQTPLIVVPIWSGPPSKRRNRPAGPGDARASAAGAPRRKEPTLPPAPEVQAAQAPMPLRQRKRTQRNDVRRLRH